MGLNECIICALSPIFNCASLSGMAPVIYTCVHEAGAREIKFVWSRSLLRTVCSIVLSFTLIVSLILNNVITNFNQIQSALRSLTEALFSISSLFLIVFANFRTDSSVRQLKAWLWITNNKKNFHLDESITSKKLYKLRPHSYYYGLIIIANFMAVLIYAGFITCNFVIQFTKYASKTHDDYILIINEKILILSALISTNVYLSTVFLFSTQTKYVRQHFHGFYKRIQNILHSGEEVEVKVKATTRYYIVSNYCVAFYNRHLNAVLLWWFLQSLIVLVFNIYLLLTMENHARVEWMLQLRVYIILGSMFYLVQLVDSINHVSYVCILV